MKLDPPKQVEIRSCECGQWKINASYYPTPPEGLIDPCPICKTSQYTKVVERDGSGSEI